eukprot:SAG22_NODE_121_length_19129_cov_36.644614_4_plen_91_part_00
MAWPCERWSARRLCVAHVLLITNLSHLLLFPAMAAAKRESLLPALETTLQRAFVGVNATLERGMETCLKIPLAEALQNVRTGTTTSTALC